MFYVITGDSGMGLTHGTLGGRLVTDLIQGRDNPWAKIYEPTRKRPDSDLFKENVNTLSQYKDLLTGGDVSSVDQIPAGEGAVIREGLHKIAVYKNETGGVTKCSAVCTHLQCNRPHGTGSKKVGIALVMGVDLIRWAKC